MERIVRNDKNGRQRFTDIHVEDCGDGTAMIVKVTGAVGGKALESRTHVKTGYDKAVMRAQTMWTNERAKVIQILPMLANKWDDREKYISEPFYVQPKLDGIRLLVSNAGCYSRTGKPVHGVEHLGKDLKDGEWLDGEMYAANMTFEDITSAFRMNPSALTFYVFDYFDLGRPDLPFAERRKYVTVETVLVKKKGDIPTWHARFVDQGHEGIMIRDAVSTYEIGKRSNYLLKYKEFQTEEYEVVGVKEGTGREKGAGIWECRVGNHVFSAKPEGTLEFRRRIFRDREHYIGKMLTVRFQNLTAQGVPRFPVGVAIRDYE